VFPSFNAFDDSFDVCNKSSVDDSAFPHILDLLTADLQGVRIVNHNIQGIRLS